MPSIYLSQVAMVAIAPLLLGSVLVTGTTSTAVALPASNIAAGPGADISESAQAVSSGQPVEVSSVTTPTQLVTALPDGSFQLQSDTVPVRVETAVGWEPVDTDLVYDSQSNTWGPRLVSASVRFSGGGRGVVAEISRESGEWLTETWNYGSLPKPTVEGPTATYHNVFPGVDLHLTATATGLSQVLEITSASAAADPRLDDFTIPVDGADLEELADGSISAVVDGEEAFVGGSPQWWDSSDKKADENEPGLTSVIRSVPQEVADSEVSLQIGDLATTPGLVFPVFVDPDWSTGAQHTWYTDRRYPTTSYLDGQNSSILRLGYNTISEVNLSRAFWEFNTAPIVGKHVLAAQFSGRKIAGQCRPTQMWRYGPVGAGFTWNQDPGAWNQHLDTQVVGQGSSCSTNATVGFNAVGGAAWAATGSNVLQLGFRAENEGDAATRTHWERGATLTVNYNSVPNAPSGASVASPVRGCGTSSAPASFHDSAGITLQTSVSDVDGGNLRTSFNVVSAATGAVAWSKRLPGSGCQSCDHSGADTCC